MSRYKTKEEEEDRYETNEKSIIRENWNTELFNLSTKLNKPLSLLVLAHNSFSDVLPLLSFSHIQVVENIPDSYKKKRKWLKYNHEYADKIKLAGPMDVYRYLTSIEGQQFDAINLDYCSHYNPKVVHALWTILSKKLLNPQGLLFITLACHTSATQRPELENKLLVRSYERMLQQIDIDLNLFGYKAENLSGFPVKYVNETCPMLSLGFTLSKL